MSYMNREVHAAILRQQPITAPNRTGTAITCRMSVVSNGSTGSGQRSYKVQVINETRGFRPHLSFTCIPRGSGVAIRLHPDSNGAALEQLEANGLGSTSAPFPTFRRSQLDQVVAKADRFRVRYGVGKWLLARTVHVALEQML